MIASRLSDVSKSNAHSVVAKLRTDSIINELINQEQNNLSGEAKKIRNEHTYFKQKRLTLFDVIKHLHFQEFIRGLLSTVLYLQKH